MRGMNGIRRGFSLIELVIVVVIIGIIAAIAVPRMSRGAAGAGDSALVNNLQVLRNGIDLFQTEHGGIFPTAATIETQLMGYSKDDGTAQAAKDNTYYLGPYVRALPPLPVGTKKGSTHIAAADGAGVGWLYDDATHDIKSNTSGEKDAKGIAYSTY